MNEQHDDPRFAIRTGLPSRPTSPPVEPASSAASEPAATLCYGCGGHANTCVPCERCNVVFCSESCLLKHQLVRHAAGNVGSAANRAVYFLVCTIFFCLALAVLFVALMQDR